MYEDVFEKDPKALLEAARGEDGEIHFENVGDDLIDKWEQEIKDGKIPDLTEGLSKETLDSLKKEQAKSARAKELEKEVMGLNEDYTDPKYRSKFVQRESVDEHEFLQKNLLGMKK